MMMFSQRDQNYSRLHLGTSADTIRSDGCLLCCVAYAIDTVADECDPPSLNRWLARNGGFIDGNRMVYAPLAELGLNLFDIGSYQNEAAPDRFIIQLINRQFVVILKVNFTPWSGFSQHWILAVNYNLDDIECLDPWHPPGVSPWSGVLTHYGLPSWSLARAIYGYVAFDYDGRDPAKTVF